MITRTTTAIETFTGRYIDYRNPQPEDIELADIARGLSQTCRFAGQTSRFYSVAEHAIYVADLVEADHPELALAALHHDSHEAYLGDWPTPLKLVLGDELVDDLRLGVDCAIARRFKFDVGRLHRPEIKAADTLAMRHEAATLKLSCGAGPHWGFDEPLSAWRNLGLHPRIAERRFIQAHRRLAA